MGYLTSFEISTPDAKTPLLKLCADLMAITSERVEISYNNLGLSIDNTKWYSYDDDMRNFSTEYPDTVFKVIGKGESAGDLWVAYYKNGLGYREAATIAYPDFFERLLKDKLQKAL